MNRKPTTATRIQSLLIARRALHIGLFLGLAIMATLFVIGLTTQTPLMTIVASSAGATMAASFVAALASVRKGLAEAGTR